MKIVVLYEDTKNSYEIPFERLLKLIKVTPASLEKAVLKVLNES